MKKNNMPGLFSLNIEDPEEVKCTKFLNKIRDDGFILAHKVYLENYINADIAIALAHIKNCYKTYVCRGKWSEEKFEGIMLIIARNRQMMTPTSFLKHGTKYDEGKLSRDITIERKKLEGALSKQNEKSDEQELLDYIAKHGGGN